MTPATAVKRKYPSFLHFTHVLIGSRRTGQSGPLGELFDHCVDAVNTTLGVLIFCSSVCTGYGWFLFLAQFATTCNFYLSTWEEFHTGTLYLSTFSGPVEGIVIVIGLFLFTAVYGPGAWYVDVLPSVVPGLNLFHLYLVFATVGLAFNIVTAASNVVHARRAAKKQVRSALTGVIPYVLFYVALFVLVIINPELISSSIQLPFTFMAGFSVALSVGLIITAHVTSQSFPVTNVLMLTPLAMLAIQALGTTLAGWDRVETIVTLVWVGLGVSVATYGFFIAEVITEITEALDIWCLTIKHPKKMD